MVAAGYDALAEEYGAWAAQVDGDPRERFLDEFSRQIPWGARVLDVGCGPGFPSTRHLAERFDVVGIDISEAQLRLARKNVPNASFVHADVAEASFPAGSFTGITALYSVSHIPRDEHAQVFRRIADWLEPGGLFLAVLGAADVPDALDEWLGVEMFFSSYDADANRALLRTAGFALLRDEIIKMREPEETTVFLWTLAQKSRSA
jgi:SAM-dependent methyltransferase